MFIGNIKLNNPFFQAALAGYTDRAMRMLARRFGCELTFSGVILDKCASYKPLFEKPKFQKPSSVSTAKGFERIKRVRVDYELIESLIEPNSRILDVGCGDGQLLLNLRQDKNIVAEGVEVHPQPFF